MSSRKLCIVEFMPLKSQNLTLQCIAPLQYKSDADFSLSPLSLSLSLSLSLARSLSLSLALSRDLAAPTQVIIPVGSVVDFSFSSHAQHAAGDRLGAALSGEALSARMVQHFEMFDRTFDHRFNLEAVPCHDAPATAKAPAVPACREATYTPEAREFGKVSASPLARSLHRGPVAYGRWTCRGKARSGGGAEHVVRGSRQALHL